MQKLLTLSLAFMLGLSLSNCGSSNQSGGTSGEKSASTQLMAETSGSNETSEELENQKQATESAEWEAHRMREELNRKKQGK